MNAYLASLASGHHTKSLLVIATDFGAAERQAMAAMASWKFEGWRVESLSLHATDSRYGKDTTLVLPTEPRPKVAFMATNIT